MTPCHRYHWVIGDVHGCHNSLVRLLRVLPKSDHLVFCGDVINRGAGIAASMELVWGLVLAGRATWLRGNHEQWLIDTLEAAHAEDQPDLLSNDTYQELGDELAREWISRLKTLPFYYRSDGWSATHAGFSASGTPDLRIREPFWETYDGRFGRVIIGHTPRPQVERHRHIVMIDTGACYGGMLSAYCPESDGVVQVQGEQHEPLQCELNQIQNKRLMPHTTKESPMVEVEPC